MLCSKCKLEVNPNANFCSKRIVSGEIEFSIIKNILLTLLNTFNFIGITKRDEFWTFFIFHMLFACAWYIGPKPWEAVQAADHRW